MPQANARISHFNALCASALGCVWLVGACATTPPVVSTPAANVRYDAAARATAMPALDRPIALAAGETDARNTSPPRRRPTSSRGFGCRSANECTNPNAECLAAVLIGKCTCQAQADCTTDEICVGGTCEVRCRDVSQCLRGGSCEQSSTEGAHCVDLRRASEDEFNPTEWDTEAERGHPGRGSTLVHATYDEWDGLKRHLRVSFRTDGRYVIEVDGFGHSDRSDAHREPGNAKGRELLRTGFLTGQSIAVPSVTYLHAASCKGELSSFRAELVLTAEFDALQTYRGIWTHPLCQGFPSMFIDAIWDFVERETGGAIARFDRELWHKVPE